jgi:vitamin B12 transporter
MKRFFSVAALIISSPLLAQQDTSNVLQDVTVTASKFSAKTTETGKVVTIINRRDIEKAGSRDLSQVITEMGGVFINGFNSNGGKDRNIYLRGAKVDHTLILVDGVPVYDASGIGSNFDIRNLSIDQVERIEILKGSQSTLYGSDAIAGVINIITRKGGGGKAFSPFATAHYGSYNTRRAAVGVNGNTGIIDYAASFSRFQSSGFSEASRPFNSTATFDNDAFKQNSVQTSFGVKVNPQVYLQSFLRASSVRGDLDEGPFKDQTDYYYSGRNLQTGLRSQLSFGTVQVTGVYQYNRTTRYYLDDAVQPGSYFLYNESNYKANEHFAEAFAVLPVGPFRLTAGLDYRAASTDYSSASSNIFNPTIVREATSGDSVRQNQVGVYAALNFSRGAFNVEGGGRYNRHSVYGGNGAFNFNPSYLINNRVKVFANISSGYKTPSLYQLFSVYGNKALKPESAVSYEAGLQYYTKDRLATVRASYFNRRVNDVIAFFFNPTTFRSNYINQDRQNDYGFEVEGNITVAQKIQLRAFYTYANGNITTIQGTKDTSYFNLLRRPRHQLNLSIGSQVTRSLYVSTQFNTVGSRADVFFDDNFRRQNVNLAAYTLVNFYAEYGFCNNRLKIFADLRNLLNERYSDIFGYNTAGFNAYGGLRFQL